MPLARRLAANFGDDKFVYITTGRITEQRRSLGWDDSAQFGWLKETNDDPTATQMMLEDADVVYGNIRDFDLFEQRAGLGRMTIYCSERWFKPVCILRFGCRMVCLPGWIRLFIPRYFRMARRVAALLRGSRSFYYYPIGKWAQRDMLLVCRLFHVPRDLAMSRMRLWSYFVEPSSSPRTDDAEEGSCGKLRALWVGRMLDWKRVDTTILAVKKCDNIEFDIYGEGPMESAWRKLAGDCPRIRFHGQVKIEQVRELMRKHEVYVLSSNAEEGWGAALNEALEEDMKVIGTYEAGSSVTILPESNLYHAGDWRSLKKLILATRDLPKVDIGEWGPEKAAERLLALVDGTVEC
jgi:glycosyltransferase involved in cell wall biosynthesis